MGLQICINQEMDKPKYVCPHVAWIVLGLLLNAILPITLAIIIGVTVAGNLVPYPLLGFVILNGIVEVVFLGLVYRARDMWMHMFVEYLRLMVQLIILSGTWIQLRVLMGANTLPYLMEFATIFSGMSQHPHWALSLAYLLQWIFGYIYFAICVIIILCKFLSAKKTRGQRRRALD